MDHHTPDNHHQRSNYATPVLSQDAGDRGSVIHQPQIYGLLRSCLHMSPSRFLRKPLFRFHQGCFSLSALSGEVGHRTRWHNWILICWHLPSRKTVHSSEPVVSNFSRLPKGFGVPDNLLSSWCHIRQVEGSAVCLLEIRLHYIESTANLGFLICKIGIIREGR